MTTSVPRSGPGLAMQPGVTCIVSLRLPPAYAAAIDDLAANLGQSKISLFRRAVEHYVSTARPEADPALVQHLLDLGSLIRDRPHPSRRWRHEAPTTTTTGTTSCSEGG